VAISGDTVVVGAPGDNSVQGSAYVFVKPGGGWATGTETAKLTASDGAAIDNFGAAVAISGDTWWGGEANIGSNAPRRRLFFVKPEAGGCERGRALRLGQAAGTIGSRDIMVGGRGDSPTSAQRQQGAAYVFVGPGGHDLAFTLLTASTGRG
jgi:hypothetical protein